MSEAERNVIEAAEQWRDSWMGTSTIMTSVERALKAAVDAYRRTQEAPDAEPE